MAVAYFYPDEDPETTSVDGEVEHEDAGGLTWANLRNGAGTAADPSDNDGYVGWGCALNVNKYDDLSRSIFLFDTSSLGLANVIISAEFRFYLRWTSGWGPDEGSPPWGADSYLNVFSSNPASNTNLVAADYAIARFGSTPFSEAKRWEDMSSGYYTFVLNADGLAAISRTGITKLALRESIYDAAGATPPYYKTDGTAYGQHWRIYFADNGSYKPRLTVTYEPIQLPEVQTNPATEIT